MSKINCGIHKLKKGERRGTMKECAEKGQVRYYGLKKIDSRVLDNVKNSKTKDNSRKAIVKKMINYKTKIKNYKSKIVNEKNKDKKEKLKNKTRDLMKEYQKYKKIFDKLEKDNKKYKVVKKNNIFFKLLL